MPKHNQTSFKKGDPRINRKGAPKREWTWAGLMENYAEKIKDKRKVKDRVVEKVYQLAERGDMTAAKELFNRMDGMPQQKTDLTSGGKTLSGLIQINETNNIKPMANKSKKRLS